MSQQSELKLEAGSTKYLLRIRNAAQVVTVCSQQERILRGTEMQTITILDSTPSRGLSVAVGVDGLITGIGFDDEIDVLLAGSTVDREVVATGMSVVPGLVDAHTHPVWVGDRVHEFAMKVRSVHSQCYLLSRTQHYRTVGMIYVHVHVFCVQNIFANFVDFLQSTKI